MKRKLLRTAAAAMSVLLILSASGCGKAGGDPVAVQSVAMITGAGNIGLADRYAGVVVSGSTDDISFDESMTLDELLVEEGQEVSAGDVLFTYDNEALLLTLEQSRLEIEQMKNSITSSQNQIKELERERSNVPETDKLQYTLEIMSLEANIKETEYNIGLKEAELARQEEISKDTEVKAKISGRVTAINKDGGTDNYGNPLPFMTIIETGNLRIKGTINEMNRGDLNAGMPVIIRSRTDETVTWSGRVDYVDWDNQVQSDNNYYYGPTDEMTSSSKYPFYITLDSYDDLFMGQHVYIEPGDSADKNDESLWLPAYFINDADGQPWVWAASSRDKLEKRNIKLGEYNPGDDTYVVESGLTADDYIAFPDETLTSGAPVEKYDEAMFPPPEGGENEYGEGNTDGYVPETDGELPMDDSIDWNLDKPAADTPAIGG